MATTGTEGSNHHGDSSQSVAPAARPKGKGGRPKHAIREHFEDVGDSNNSSHRPGAACKHCQLQFTSPQATPAALVSRIVDHCTKAPSNVKQQWMLQSAAAQANSTSGEAAVAVGVKRKATTPAAGTTRQTTLHATMATSAYQLAKQQRTEVDFHFLRWAVCNKIPFKAFNCPHVHAALRGLRPHYELPCPTTFKDNLSKEYRGVKHKLQARLEDAQNLTLAADCWTDPAKRSVLAFLLHFPDRTTALLEVQEVSEDKHTAEMLAGVYNAGLGTGFMDG